MYIENLDERYEAVQRLDDVEKFIFYFMGKSEWTWQEEWTHGQLAREKEELEAVIEEWDKVNS